jgi:hypothetical protein
MVNFRLKYFSERILQGTGSDSSFNIENEMNNVQKQCIVPGCLTCFKDQSEQCEYCAKHFILNETNHNCTIKDGDCSLGYYKYDGVNCVKNSKFDSHCDKFTNEGNGPVCETGKCKEKYGLSMPIFGGICVECPVNCEICTNSYSCNQCEKGFRMFSEGKSAKCIIDKIQAFKNIIKGCTQVDSGKCTKCQEGLDLINDKCEIKENHSSEELDKIQKLSQEDKTTISIVAIEKKIINEPEFKKIIMQMYTYLRETKLNIIGRKAFKHYYTFGPRRFRPSFPIKYRIVRSSSRRDLDENEKPIELECSPEVSSESEGEGVIHNICSSQKEVGPEEVFCEGCTVQAEKPDNGLKIDDNNFKINDTELEDEINQTVINTLENEMMKKTFKIKDLYIKNGVYFLKFNPKTKEVKKGLELTVLVTFIKKQRRNRILESGKIEVGDAVLTIDDDKDSQTLEANYRKPDNLNEEEDKIIDAAILSSGGSSSIKTEDIIDALNGVERENSISNVNKSSSGLSGGAIAAIVIVSCVVIISIIAITIAIKTKAIGGVKPSYEIANNCSTTSGKTVQQEQVYI